MNTKTVEALDFTWHLSENNVLSDYQRDSFRTEAFKYAEAVTKPSERAVVRTLLLPYFADIFSAVEKVMNAAGEEIEMLITPENWLEIAQKALNGREDELVALLNAAEALNPHWYPVVLETPEILKQTEASTNLENPKAPDTPDSETIVGAANEFAETAEKEAKKKA